MRQSLSKEYLSLINKAYDATSRKEAIKLIYKATALAEQIAALEKKMYVKSAS